jgi:hypothetical protein
MGTINGARGPPTSAGSGRLHRRSCFPHQAVDGLGVGGTSDEEKHTFRGGGGHHRSRRAARQSATSYLPTNLAHPDSERSKEEDALAPADLSEVVRLYSLRMWVEHSYKQVKHVLG